VDDDRQLLDDQLARLLSSFQDDGGQDLEPDDDEYPMAPQYDDELYQPPVRYIY